MPWNLRRTFNSVRDGIRQPVLQMSKRLLRLKLDLKQDTISRSPQEVNPSSKFARARTNGGSPVDSAMRPLNEPPELVLYGPL